MSSPHKDTVTENKESCRTLFVGDVHGCADELEMLLLLVKPTRVVLLGDLFTKGPKPKKVWRLIQKWKAESILGNQDEYVVQRFLLKGTQRIPSSDCKLSKKAIKWLEGRPIIIKGDGWKAIHAGVNPTGEKTTRWFALCARRWPDDQNSDNPFWWELYKGKELIIYGHDAKRGLQDHRPYSLGLDSGCVYGGGLSGYLLEENRLVSVPSQAYYPIVDKNSE